MADTATFSAAMKTKFLGPIRDNLPRGKVLLFGDPEANPTQFKGILSKAEGIDFVGNEFRIPMKTERNNAVGFRHEGELLPAPGHDTYTYIQEPLRFAYGAFSISGQLMKAAESNEGAFRPAFKEEMESTLLALKLDFNRAAHGDGSGKMATLTATEVIGQTVLSVDTTINFRGSEIVDFVDSSGNVVQPARKVVGIDRENLTITVSPALDAQLTTANFAVRASADSTIAVPNNSQNREIQGIGSIVTSSGTLHGVNPATVPHWKADVKAVGGPITDRVFRDAKDSVGFETGLDVDSGLEYAMLTTRGIRSRYADTLTALKRFNDDQSMKLHGGYSALMFDENPIFIDDQCPTGTLYGLALNRLFWSQMSDWEWMEEDGKVLKWIPGRDKYQAVLFKYCNLGTTHRASHFKRTGITDDVR